MEQNMNPVELGRLTYEASPTALKTIVESGKVLEFANTVAAQRERGTDRADSRTAVAAPPPAPGSATVSETDIRGLLILHIVSSDGRLGVQE
jgi:hypothetical protein